MVKECYPHVYSHQYGKKNCHVYLCHYGKYFIFI